jgi:hypothetical protein
MRACDASLKSCCVRGWLCGCGMSVERLERAAQALEPVLGDVVFLGGASIVLWITDPAAPAPRPTKDVDVVVEVSSRAAFHAFEERLRSLGFKEDRESDIICRPGGFQADS